MQFWLSVYIVLVSVCTLCLDKQQTTLFFKSDELRIPSMYKLIFVGTSDVIKMSHLHASFFIQKMYKRICKFRLHGAMWILYYFRSLEKCCKSQKLAIASGMHAITINRAVRYNKKKTKIRWNKILCKPSKKNCRADARIGPSDLIVMGWKSGSSN